MKRIAAVLATSGVLLLGSAGVAHADTGSPPMDGGCGGGYVGDALATGLHYRYTVWDASAGPAEGSLGIDAPRGWSFVRTPQAEGRFHDPTGNDLLSLREPTRAATPAAAMSSQVRALAGTPGLKVLGQHVKVMDSLGQRWATLAYRYSNMGEPRIVKERWIAYGTDSTDQAVMVVTVAGRVMDGSGLDALLAHVSPTAQLAG
ncbi:MAG: hypothetical protein QOD98_784 [Nocardioidaceae bacterium]|jgi:hypothetical protein|nr:hypothetical protein [Nocardioidaceae bacterium]